MVNSLVSTLIALSFTAQQKLCIAREQAIKRQADVKTVDTWKACELILGDEFADEALQDECWELITNCKPLAR